MDINTSTNVSIISLIESFVSAEVLPSIAALLAKFPMLNGVFNSLVSAVGAANINWVILVQIALAAAEGATGGPFGIVAAVVVAILQNFATIFPKITSHADAAMALSRHVV